jgi:hypothetical protein
MTARRHPVIDLSPGVGFSVEHFVKHWQRAVETQSRRFRSSRLTPDQRRVEGVFLVMALRQLLRAASFAQRKMNSTVLRAELRSFKRALPGIEESRDALEHFDQWRMGKGRKQKREPDGTWVYIQAVYRDPNDAVFVVRLDSTTVYRFSAKESVAASRRLARAVVKEINRYVRVVQRTGEPPDP